MLSRPTPSPNSDTLAPPIDADGATQGASSPPDSILYRINTRIAALARRFGFMPLSFLRAHLRRRAQTRHRVKQIRGRELAILQSEMDALLRHASQARDLAEHAFSQSDSLMVQMDLIGRIRHASDRLGEVLKTPPQDLVGRDWCGEFVHPEDAAELSAMLKDMLSRQPRVRKWNATLRAADGSQIPGTWTCVVETDPEGRPEGWLCTARDGGPDQEGIGKMLRALAHDVKGAARTIDSLAQWIQDDPKAMGSSESREYLITLRQRAQNLHRLIEGMQDYMRAEPGRGPAVLVTAGRLLDELQRRMGLGEAMLLQVEDEAGEFLALEPDLASALGCLLDNAVRHHGPGPCQVQVRARDIGASVEFLVQDDGPGIAPRFAEMIFEPFHTLAPKGAGSGVGMGLCVAARIAVSRGGSLALVPSPAQGALFRLVWPKGA